MSTLQDEVKRILEEAMGLKFRVRYHPDLDDPKWDVLLEKQLALIMPLYESYEAILAVSGYSNEDIIIEPKIKNSLKNLAEKLDHKLIGSFLIGDRYDWAKAKKNFPNAVTFLQEMEKLVDGINSRYGSGLELHLDQENEEWWLQARFNSKKMSHIEILQRVERNIKGLLEALKEYHKRIEALERL